MVWKCFAVFVWFFPFEWYQSRIWFFWNIVALEMGELVAPDEEDAVGRCGLLVAWLVLES